MGTPEGTTWLVYVDDSGDENHDLLVALCFPVADGAAYLATWKRYRVYLFKKVSFPLGCEFHSNEFLKRNGVHLGQ